MKQYIYDGTYEQFKAAAEAHRLGCQLVCYKCRTPLLVALDWQEAERQRTSPGIYCPKAQRHVALILNLKETSEAVRRLADNTT